MSASSRMSTHTPKDQTVRKSQDQKPRYLPPMPAVHDPRSDFNACYPQPGYTLQTSVSHDQPEGNIQGTHYRSYNQDHLPDADSSLSYAHLLQSLPPCYNAAMVDPFEQHPPNYASSSAYCDTTMKATLSLPTDTGAVYQMAMQPFDIDQNMMGEYDSSGESSGSSPGTGLSPYQQYPDAQFSADDNMSSSSFSYGMSTALIPNSSGYMFPEITMNDQNQHFYMPGLHRSAGSSHLLTPPESDYSSPAETDFSYSSPRLSDCAIRTQDIGTSSKGTSQDHCNSATTMARVSSSEQQSAASRHTPVAPRLLRSASDRRSSQDSQDTQESLDCQTGTENNPNSNKPRSHPYYNLERHQDGKYYCPFYPKRECEHKEGTTQKCVYDKWLDSHLKPFLCQDASCTELKFSSNACLFRHQREAHGMHGHGQSPHMCLFPNCDRSKPDMGFPRKWNLGDHMKRVHHYNVSANGDYTGPSQELPPKQGLSQRKRKAAPAVASVPMKRQSQRTKVLPASAHYSEDQQQFASSQSQSQSRMWVYPSTTGYPESDGFSLPVATSYPQHSGYPLQARHDPVYISNYSGQPY